MRWVEANQGDGDVHWTLDIVQSPYLMPDRNCKMSQGGGRTSENWRSTVHLGLLLRGHIQHLQGGGWGWKKGYHHKIAFRILTLTFSHSQIGEISKKWTGLGEEMFTDADNFGVSFPEDLDIKVASNLSFGFRSLIFDPGTLFLHSFF